MTDADSNTGWCIIPPWVMADRNLTMAEKVLYGRILGLSDKHGYCYASNNWLGEQVGMDGRSVRRSVTSLQAKGYVRRVVFGADNRTSKRAIYPRMATLHPQDPESSPQDTMSSPPRTDCPPPQDIESSQVRDEGESNRGTHTDVQQVFEHWQQVTGKHKAKLTNDRKQKVQARLREGFSVDELKEAVDGLAKSAWHQGDNPQGKRYDDLALVCRQGSKVEQFIELARTGGGNGANRQSSQPRSAAGRTRANARAAAERGELD